MSCAPNRHNKRTMTRDPSGRRNLSAHDAAGNGVWCATHDALFHRDILTQVCVCGLQLLRVVTPSFCLMGDKPLAWQQAVASRCRGKKWLVWWKTQNTVKGNFQILHIFIWQQGKLDTFSLQHVNHAKTSSSAVDSATRYTKTQIVYVS